MIFANRRINILLVIALLHIASVMAAPAFLPDPEKSIAFNNIFLDANYDFGTVEAIAQDTFGFIWIGAKDGLYRYDGISFSPYLHSLEDTNSLSSNTIRTLLVDDQGTLWVGTEFGLNKYRVESDDFKRYLGRKQSGFSDNNIRKIIQDDKGYIWIATRGGGISRFDSRKDEFVSLSQLLKSGREKLAANLRTIYIDKHQNLWIGTVDKGVLYLSLNTLNLISLDSIAEIKGYTFPRDIRAITRDIKGNMWFGSNGGGMVQFNPQKSIFTSYNKRLNGAQNISSNIIWSLTIDSKGTLWACTDGGGLMRLDNGDSSFSFYTYSASNQNCISSNVVRTLFEDNAGNYWVGNFEAALNYIQASKRSFFKLKDLLPDARVNRNKITAILKASSNMLWLATDGEGVICIDPGSDKMINYRHQKNNHNSLCNNKPISLEEDANGNIWIGHFEGGLSCYLQKEKKFICFKPGPGDANISGDQVWDLLADDEKLWIASNMGLDILDLKTHKIAKADFKTTGTDFIHYGVWSLLKDSQQRLFIGTYNGLYIYNEKENTLSYHTNDDSAESLSDKWITALFEDQQGKIWVGTHGGGLNCWLGENKFKHLTEKNGLIGNSVSAILGDSQGRLWISTNRGLSCYMPATNEFINYNRDDGLQGNRFQRNSSFKDQEGWLYFGGNNGVSIFNPANINKNEYVPPVHITAIQINGNTEQSAVKNFPVTGNIMLQDEIHLYKEHRILTLHFAALNFTQSQKNHYKYQLEGFDDNWHEVANQNYAIYTSLPSGHYTFHVMGSNNDGVWNTEGAKLSIIVHPPFYKSFWFIGLLLLLIGFLAGMLYKIRVTNVKQLNERLSEQVAQRTRELEKRSEEIAEQRDIATEQRDKIRNQNEELEKHRTRLEELVEERTQDLMIAKNRAEESDRLKTAFLENLSHEIRTPMNAIVGFINLLADKIDDKNSREYYMHIINESGKNMLSLVQDIIDFSRLQAGQLQPEYRECSVHNMINELITSSRMKASREKPKLNIFSQLPEHELIIFTDGKKVKTVFTKLLENSLKFTDHGHIKLGISQKDEKWITFFVEDTGIGIKPEHNKKIFDRFFTEMEDTNSDQFRGSGLGLAFAKLIMELLGGKIWVESIEEKGSTFFFTLPFMHVVNKEKSTHSSTTKRYFWPDKKVLVAEDEDSNFLLIEAILRDSGVKLIHCADGVELLEKVNAGMEYDLVLLDLKMPRMGGINAMKIIRESNKNVPVVVQTAYDQTNHRQQCIEFGCNDFLVKPLRKKELLDTLEKYFD